MLLRLCGKFFHGIFLIEMKPSINSIVTASDQASFGNPLSSCADWLTGQCISSPSLL